MLLESVPNAVSAGQSMVVARMALIGNYDTDVELGVGRVTESDPLTIWAYGRIWDGMSFVSYDVTTYAFDGLAGSCDDPLGSAPPQLGASWADRPPSTGSFLTAEFSYANQAGTAEASLRTSRGASFRQTAPAGCALPAALPVLITLDHNAPDAPAQRIDYVYVRPVASREPTATVSDASTLPCSASP